GGVRSIADIQSASYSKSEDDALLLNKADKTDLNGYVTLNTAQNIIANKTFSRFTSTIDGMPTITGSLFVKSGSDDNHVLLACGGEYQLNLLQNDQAVPIIAFDSIPLKDSRVGSAGISTEYSRADHSHMCLSDTTNKPVKDTNIGNIGNFIFYTRSDHAHPLNINSNATHVPLVNASAASNGTSDCYCRNDHVHPQQLSYDGNLTATGFIKQNLNNTSILLAGGGDMLLSEIATESVDLSNYYDKNETYSKSEDDELLNTTQTITANKTFQNSSRFASTIDGMSTITGSSFIKSGSDDNHVLLAASDSNPLIDFGIFVAGISNDYS
ncbi:MAG: hypothetical protein EZS28_048743, partial [Streblomastix strix]